MHANTERGWQEVIEDLSAVGLRATSGGRRYDLVLDIDGRTCGVEVTRASVVSPAHVHALSPREGTDSAAISLLVADRISEAARRLLVDRGWSWLDMRGHAYVRAPGVLVDASFRPRDVVPTPRSAGRAWREVCFALLREPQVAVGVRPLARMLDLSPAAVSGVLAQLREASLLDRDGRPLLPELFWVLAERWEVRRVALRRAPQPQDPDLELGLDTSQAAPGIPTGTRGWALTDTVAATLYGAPLGVGTGWPPDFYVPDSVVLRRAVRALGQAETWDDRGATAAVAPVRQVCSLRQNAPDTHVPGTHWLLADPLAVALDLAQDTSRGVEVLRDWTPPAWAARVWA
ncbi:MAG: hypothetical protein Q8R60_07485 [Mycobacteriales bacterium]|nr:hypothetical protein [Mycobacteriales bacterium]